MNKVNTIYISKERQGENYKEVAANIIDTLLTEDEIVIVRRELPDTFIIEHEHDESVEPWGGVYPYWLTAEEASDIKYCNGGAD